MSLAYLAAAAPDPNHVALVSKLAIVLGPTEAEKIVTSLEKVVEKRASEGATKAAKPFIYGMAAMLAFGLVQGLFK